MGRYISLVGSSLAARRCSNIWRNSVSFETVMLAREHERMALGLPELMAQLGNDVKLQSSVGGELLS
jgi:hypothetical protein